MKYRLMNVCVVKRYKYDAWFRACIKDDDGVLYPIHGFACNTDKKLSLTQVAWFAVRDFVLEQCSSCDNYNSVMENITLDNVFDEFVIPLEYM